ncbi:unnamed protein product [Orchesella dallaii]|uniref:Uncharacterized protein n=1 Tax=Orchesella dallaii TaxID=48710 RepID=A0ABP1QKM4_9HEXA
MIPLSTICNAAVLCALSSSSLKDECLDYVKEFLKEHDHNNNISNNSNARLTVMEKDKPNEATFNYKDRMKRHMSRTRTEFSISTKYVNGFELLECQAAQDYEFCHDFHHHHSSFLGFSSSESKNRNMVGVCDVISRLRKSLHSSDREKQSDKISLVITLMSPRILFDDPCDIFTDSFYCLNQKL